MKKKKQNCSVLGKYVIFIFIHMASVILQMHAFVICSLINEIIYSAFIKSEQ